MMKKHKAALSLTGSDLSSWPHLMPELLYLIFALLSTSDRHRFRQICSTWRDVARHSSPPFPVPFEPPRLLLTRPDNSLYFFDLFNCKSISFSLSPPHRQDRCFGYLAGWFFLVSDQNPSRACLFNPVLLTEIPLPDLDSPIEKAILSAPPGSPNCVVAVMGRSTFIALCEPAGKRWQVLDLGQPILFQDIAFWQNQLCGIENLGNVLICNFDMESRKTSILKVRLPWQYRFTFHAFLVESTSGDLLIVLAANYNLWVFKFKLDQKCTWEEMEQIGDQALFLGKIRSESVSINQFLDSGLKRNSIYLTSTTRKFENRHGAARVYSMENRKTTPMRIYERYCILAEPVWVSPVIWP